MDKPKKCKYKGPHYRCCFDCARLLVKCKPLAAGYGSSPCDGCYYDAQECFRKRKTK